jgi:hypothetical protein
MDTISTGALFEFMKAVSLVPHPATNEIAAKPNTGNTFTLNMILTNFLHYNTPEKQF